MKLIGYFGSAVNVVSSNPCVGTSPRIKIYFSLSLICTDELISAAKIMTFFPKLPTVKNSEENKILYLYLSRSAFLVSFANPNKQLPYVKSVFKFLNFGPSV